MKRFGVIIILIALLLAGIGILCFTSTSSFTSVLIVFLESVISICLSSFVDFFNAHGQGFKIWFQSKIKFRNDMIRLSFSYLFKICVDNKYLFIRGHRLKNQYQPIGGVYKYYDEAKPQLEKMKYDIDTRMNNFDEPNDLRIRMPGKYILDFMDWFKTMENREYDPRREFLEELVSPGILPSCEFGEIEYRKIAEHDSGIVWSKFLECFELLHADIFEIKLNETQKQAIRNAVEASPNELVLVTTDEIQKLCFNGIEKNLGTNSSWILNQE